MWCEHALSAVHVTLYTFLRVLSFLDNPRLCVFYFAHFCASVRVLIDACLLLFLVVLCAAHVFGSVVAVVSKYCQRALLLR